MVWPDRPWGPPSLLYNGYRLFPGGKERPGRDADPSPILVPWSRKSRVIPLLPLRAVRPVQSLSACTRLHFTFTFTMAWEEYDRGLRKIISSKPVLQLMYNKINYIRQHYLFIYT